MEDSAAEGQRGPCDGLAELVTRMVQREWGEAAEVEEGELAELARSLDEEIDGLAAAVAGMRGDVEAVRAWCEGLEARQAQLEALLRLRVALRAEAAEGSGSG